MSKKIIEYKVVDCYSTEELTRRVTHYLDEGWQPYGSMQAFKDGITIRCVQAVVQYAELDKNPKTTYE